jgi:large subunit ribosomal protein L15
MITLSNLTNSTRPFRKIQRVGRGIGSGRGKTCCRGHKGDKARSGYKRRYGHEGGQLPLYRKLPCRGFDHGRFKSNRVEINLKTIEALYSNGEVVNIETLREKGYAPRRSQGGLKVLSGGELTKKVSIEARVYSKAAQEKLEKRSIAFKTI